MTFDPRVKAAEYALNIYTALGGKGSERVEAPGLYTRARSFPALLVSSSLLPAIAFALSKTENLAAVDTAYTILAGGKGDTRLLVEDVGRGEGGGYAVMAAVVARILNDAGFCSISSPVAVSLARCLLDLEKKGAVLVAERVVMETLQEFKKYVEAFIKRRQEG